MSTVNKPGAGGPVSPVVAIVAVVIALAVVAVIAYRALAPQPLPKVENASGVTGYPNSGGPRTGYPGARGASPPGPGR